MRNNVQLMFDKLNKTHRRKRGWQKIVMILAAIVVFCTTYALILPAITWERMLICEKEEHVHQDSCYNTLTDGNRELVCEKEEHIHTDSCFDAPPAVNNIYVCRQVEHTHNELCYFPDGTSRCTIPEHIHTAACLSESAASAIEADAPATAPTGHQPEASAEGQIDTAEESQPETVVVAEMSESSAEETVPENPTEMPAENEGEGISVISAEAVDETTEVLSETDDGMRSENEQISPAFETEELLAEGEASVLEEDIITEDEVMISEISARPMMLAAAPLLGATDDKVAYWKKITSTNEIDTNSRYIIVANNGDKVFGVSKSGNNYSVSEGTPDFSQWKNTTVYTSSLGEAYQWTLSGSGSSYTLKNVEYTNRGLRLDNNSILSSSTTSNTYSYNSGYWTINYSNYYLRYNTSFERSNSSWNSDRRNMTIYKYIGKDVTFEPNYSGGEKVSYTVPENYTLNDISAMIPVPERSGYVFAGWSLDGKTALTDAQILSAKVAENTTYTALWRQSSTVILDPGIASEYGPQTFTVPAGKTLSEATGFSIPEWTFDGHTLIGWSKDGGTTVLTNEQLKQVTVSENTTYVAQWAEAKTVSFDVGEYGSEIATIDPINISIGASLTEAELPIPLWNSAHPLPFEGWFIDSEYTTPYTGQPINADTVLYAKFGEDDNAYYVFYYDYDRGTGESIILRTFAVEEGDTLKPYDLRDVSPPESQSWDGSWYLNPERTAVYNFSTPVSEMTDYLTGNTQHDLYLWPGAYSSYRVIFVTNGHRLAPALIREGTKLNLDDYTPTKDGCEFAGWYKDEALTQPVSGLQDITTDTSFYAKWTPGYVKFIPVMHTENAADFNFTSAGLLSESGWYALNGSTVYVKSDGPDSSTHKVYCKLPNDDTEYPVYTNEPTKTAAGWSGTQATITDVFQKYFIFYDETSSQWADFQRKSGDSTAKPYTTNTILPSGDSIVAFSYLRARMDVTFTFSNNSSSGGYMDMYTLKQNGIIDGTNTAASAGNNSCTGTFANGSQWEYKAASNSNGMNTFVLKNVKYEEFFPTHWPVANWITNRGTTNVFRTWKYSSSNQTSKLINFTDNYISGTGRNATAETFTGVFESVNPFALMYAVQVLPGETADFTLNNVGYKIDDRYTQLVYTTGTFTPKQIAGCEAGAVAYYSKNSSRYTLTTTAVNALLSQRADQYFSGNNSVTSFTGAGGAVYVFYYDRFESSLEFNFAYDANNDGKNEIIDYTDLLYGQDIGEYRYGMPDGERSPYLTREGYVFKGWMNEYNEIYTDEDWDTLNTNTLANGAKMVFTAKWEPEDGNIIEFYDSEFSLEPAEIHTFYDGEYVAAPSNIRPDLGWTWTNSDTAQKTAYNGDIPLYGEYGVWEYRPDLNRFSWVIKVHGQWAGQNPTVVYDVNVNKGGIPENAPTDSSEYTLGVSSVPVMALSSTQNTQNKKFVGWKLRNNGVIYQPGDHILAQWMPSMTFIAQWVDQADIVHLKYDANGGTPTAQYPNGTGYDYARNASAFVWDNMDVTTEHFTKEHYRFIGWSTEPGEQPVQYPPGSSIQLTADSTTLYAQWELMAVPLTVKKQVINVANPLYSDTTTSFEFTATLADGAEFPEPGPYDYYTVDENNVAHFSLKHGEQVVMTIPIGSVVTITELTSSGYHVKYLTDDAPVSETPTWTFTMGEDGENVEVQNIIGQRLPSTGDGGTLFYYISGTVLMALALIYGFVLWKKRERRSG